MNNFDFAYLKNLNFSQQKEYIIKFFVPLSNGTHCFLQNDNYELMTDEIIKKVYFNRFDKKLSEFYFKEYTDIKHLVYEINKPQFYDNNINLCPALPVYKPYKDFDDTIKAKAKIFLDFMFEVLCNKNISIQTHLNKWIANLCHGNKNDCAIILKTNLEGVGKSTLPKMISDYILGPKLSLECGSDPLKSKFNSILGGKLFVNFEELETFSTAEWLSVDCVLKRQITSNIINLQKKGQDAFEAKNINNYMLLSNHDVADSGRRYFVLDIQTHRKGDIKYWDNIYNNCFNNTVGSCLYSYFREIDITNFHAQAFPLTNNKLKSISKRLDTVYQFIKDEYLLKQLDINSKLKDFYDIEFLLYCNSKNKKPCNKHDFTSKLSEIQINYIKSNGYNHYKLNYKVLKQISDKFHWISDLDDDTIENVVSNKVETNLDYGLEKNDNNEILELKNTILEYEKIIEKYKLKEEKRKLKKENKNII